MTVGLFILISFTNSFSDRIRQAYNYRTTLAFSQFATSSNYLTYNQYVLNGEAQSRIKAIQTSIPPGAEIIAWIKTPFYLDYKRNIIYDAEPAGLANPWAHIPQAEYVMYEYRGFAVRPYTDFIARLNAEPGRHERQIAQRCLVFLNFLHAIRSNADEIYNDGKIVVYKINL